MKQTLAMIVSPIDTDPSHGANTMVPNASYHSWAITNDSRPRLVLREHDHHEEPCWVHWLHPQFTPVHETRLGLALVPS